MKGQLLRQFALGVLLLAAGFASLPVSAEQESPREGTCAGASELFPDTNPGPGSLKALRPKRIPELGTYVSDRRAAIALGKALFWDMQVGSDGIQDAQRLSAVVIPFTSCGATSAHSARQFGFRHARSFRRSPSAL